MVILKRDMQSSSNREVKIFLAFGVITIMSGIYLITQKDYLIGCSGSAVGMMIAYQNMMKLKTEEGE